MSEIFTPQSGEDSNDDRPRLVLDTNTVLALWMFRDPKLEALREWIDAGRCRLYSREDALEELRRVLAYPQFRLDVAAQNSIVQHYQTRLTPPEGTMYTDLEGRLALLPRCRDSDDQKFLQLACETGADLVLTRDRALLRLARKTRTRLGFDIIRCDTLSAELNANASAGRLGMTHIPLRG